ncbi:MAG: MipA/OmpV family protein [Gammaproteobacteria bacterium]|nr:MipA/OmpV family protein [Gammaproteobacteria bacterium]
MKRVIAGIVTITFAMSSYAYDIPEKNWGIAIGIRDATIPFKTEEESVQDIIPLLYYDGDLFFIRGLSGGVKLFNNDAWQFSLLGKYRYFDIPAEYQNLLQGNALDIGGQLKYRFKYNFEANFEILNDQDHRYYTSLNTRYLWKSASWELFPYADLRFKSADFNDYYYGLDGFSEPGNPSSTLNNKIGSAFDMTVGSELRYHVTSNFYLLGRAQYTALDSKTRNSISIENSSFGEIYMGIAFFNDRSSKKVSSLKAKPYGRVAHGWATPSNLGDTIVFNAEGDDQNNQLTSFFYGHPIADSLFGIEAVDLYITTGYVYHHGSDSYSQTLTPGQGINTSDSVDFGNNPCDGINPCTITYNKQPTSEYILAIKAYYNMSWPVHWRIGLAEGLSYIETVSNLEQREMDIKGYRSSQLMNYIDFTVDFSLGDAFGVGAMREIYLGAGIHHRSSIFESSSAFGRIKGGSNYPSLYLQYHW